MLRAFRKSDDGSVWARAITKALAFAEQRGARVIGVTGERTGSGASALCEEMVRACNRYGLRSLLVDASRMDIAALATEEDPSAPFDLLSVAELAPSGIAVVDLAKYVSRLPATTERMRQMLGAAADRDFIVLVDLPAINARTVNGGQTLGLVGASCALAYLVCLSGLVTRVQLSECIESCRILRVPVEGVIVNDWKQRGARLATGW